MGEKCVSPNSNKAASNAGGSRTRKGKGKREEEGQQKEEAEKREHERRVVKYDFDGSKYDLDADLDWWVLGKKSEVTTNGQAEVGPHQKALQGREAASFEIIEIMPL